MKSVNNVTAALLAGLTEWINPRADKHTRKKGHKSISKKPSNHSLPDGPGRSSVFTGKVKGKELHVVVCDLRSSVEFISILLSYLLDNDHLRMLKWEKALQ